ncbi:hypothetical protein SAMN05421736_108109 [Evansella caseinilytica]|uniref:Uncharacterized protein n=1 Tax=Evansella caseinilytica TaxID=1503961 RepID=A0A1H3RHT0_9BACI|nr:hypothetical protein [Evansella caseinilytica]SDZ25180.1 hypothetical protein SAMN05421736_108109 [Evansella caseinilytica]
MIANNDQNILSSRKKKNRLNEISSTLDKRSSGYNRRLDALQTAPVQISSMVQRAMNAGIEAACVLMDTWFTHQSLIKNITEQAIDMISMIKE